MTYDSKWIHQRLDDMTDDLRRLLAERERNDIKLVGIHSGGAWVADALQQRLGKIPLGSLDISFYRDDFTHRGLHPNVKPSQLPFEVEGAHILLVDDVQIVSSHRDVFNHGNVSNI